MIFEQCKCITSDTYLLATVIAIVFRSSRSAVIAGRSVAFWADNDVPSVELPDWEVALSQYDRQALNLLATSVTVREVRGGETRRFNTCSGFPTRVRGLQRSNCGFVYLVTFACTSSWARSSRVSMDREGHH